MILVRECYITDAETIQRINAEVMGYDHPLDDTRNNIDRLLTDPDHGIFVAECDGRIAGYIHLNVYQTLYFAPMKNILCLAVFPEYRRRGIASELLKKAEEWALETGARGIRLDSGAERLPAHACYQKAGYQQTKMHKYFVKRFF